MAMNSYTDGTIIIRCDDCSCPDNDSTGHVHTVIIKPDRSVEHGGA